MVLVCHSTALPYPPMALSMLISVAGDKSLLSVRYPLPLAFISPNQCTRSSLLKTPPEKGHVFIRTNQLVDR